MSAPAASNAIVAVVGYRVITFEDVRLRIQPGPLRLDGPKRRPEDEVEDVIESLIDDAVIVQDWRAHRKRDLSQRDFEAELNRRLATDHGGDRDRLLEELRRRGQSFTDYRHSIEDDLIVRTARAEVRATAAPATPAQIETFYAANLERFTHRDGMHFRLIKLSPPADEDLANLQQTADVVMKRLRGGEDFSALAKDYSQDSSRKSGGDWGWWARSDLRDELGDAAFALEPGHFTEPIRVDRDIFILFVVEKRRAGLAPLSEVRPQIEALLVSQRQREAEERWLTSLRSKAKIQVFP